MKYYQSGRFKKNPKDFHSLETSVKTSTESFAATFFGEVLSGLSSCIFGSGWRKDRYVSNKVHGIAEEMPDIIHDEPESVPYLFIEADEAHVAEQHGKGNDKKDNKSFISRLIYIYEYKQDSGIASGRKELVNVHYFGGLYPGTDGNSRLWGKVSRFIELNYDTDKIKKIFISGDGAPWIKKGTDHIYNSVFCAD